MCHAALPRLQVYNAWTQACVYPGAVGTHGCKCSKAYRNDKPMAVGAAALLWIRRMQWLRSSFTSARACCATDWAGEPLLHPAPPKPMPPALPPQVACEVCRYHQKVGFFPFPGDHELFVEVRAPGPAGRTRALLRVAGW